MSHSEAGDVRRPVRGLKHRVPLKNFPLEFHSRTTTAFKTTSEEACQ